MAFIIMQGPITGGVDVVPSTVTDFEILLDDGEIEMFEDLEFYALMDELEANGNVG
jgi:hypothetical protein